MQTLDHAAIVAAYQDGAKIKQLAQENRVGLAKIMRILDAAGIKDRRSRPREGGGRDITGQRFGRLIALHPTGNRRDANIEWELLCDCGATTYSTPHSLLSGNTKSCGCYKKDRITESQRKDITGQRFGSLTAVEFSHNNTKANGNKGSAYWKWRCDCGAELTASGAGVRARFERRGVVSCKRCAAKARARDRRRDYTGVRIGLLTGVYQINPAEPPTVSAWLWQCDCGNTCTRTPAAIEHNPRASCGCGRVSNAADRTGERFGALVALRSIGKLPGENTYTWEFQCDCGRLCRARLRDAVSGLQRSCGCRQGGYDTIEAWANGTFRDAEAPAVFYVFRLARFADHVKPGIAKDIESRIRSSRGEYGELHDFIALPRLDAWLIEQAVLHATKAAASCPAELRAVKWEGHTEVRKLDPAAVFDLAIQLHDHLQERGRVEFALQYLPLTQPDREALAMMQP